MSQGLEHGDRGHADDKVILAFFRKGATGFHTISCKSWPNTIRIAAGLETIYAEASLKPAGHRPLPRPKPRLWFGERCNRKMWLQHGILCRGEDLHDVIPKL